MKFDVNYINKDVHGSPWATRSILFPIRWTWFSFRFVTHQLRAISEFTERIELSRMYEFHEIKRYSLRVNDPRREREVDFPYSKINFLCERWPRDESDCLAIGGRPEFDSRRSSTQYEALLDSYDRTYSLILSLLPRKSYWDILRIKTWLGEAYWPSRLELDRFFLAL